MVINGSSIKILLEQLNSIRVMSLQSMKSRYYERLAKISGVAQLACPRCHGTGKRNLTAPYRDCFESILALGKPTISDIHDRSGGTLHLTATTRRVELLIEWGLVRKVSNERPMRYEVVGHRCG